MEASAFKKKSHVHRPLMGRKRSGKTSKGRMNQRGRINRAKGEDPNKLIKEGGNWSREGLKGVASD